jgi:hypothetical protein
VAPEVLAELLLAVGGGHLLGQRPVQRVPAPGIALRSGRAMFAQTQDQQLSQRSFVLRR